LVVSARECAASASIAADPLIAPATIFATAIVALDARAIFAVLRLSELRSGRRLRLLVWAAVSLSAFVRGRPFDVCGPLQFVPAFAG
jgi:hypothetical protein